LKLKLCQVQKKLQHSLLVNMPANTTPFTIKIQLGSKKATIMLDPSNTYSSFSMNSSLSFNAEQRLFVKVSFETYAIIVADHWSSRG